MDAFDEAFFAEQNAVVVRDAEEYYQQMYRAEVSSWNLRDRHMANTADALLEHLGHDRRSPSWWSGSTTPMWATPGRRR